MKCERLVALEPSMVCVTVILWSPRGRSPLGVREHDQVVVPSDVPEHEPVTLIQESPGGRISMVSVPSGLFAPETVTTPVCPTCEPLMVMLAGGLATAAVPLASISTTAVRTVPAAPMVATPRGAVACTRL